MSTPRPTALVTGASSGIGAAFCRELARSGHDLVVVSRSRDALEDLAGGLRAAYGVSVTVMPADLADREQVGRVAERIAGTSGSPDAAPIDLLVNNAGFGIGQAFLDGDLGEEERALEVMCRAVLVLSHAAGRAMRARGQGGIINVSSVAGFVQMGTYSAIKAWVTTFTEGLSTELRADGVRVTALCPGFTHTDFHRRAELDMAKLPEALWLDADDLVRTCLRDHARGRVISVPGTAYRAVTAAVHVLPRGVVRRVSGSLASVRRPPAVDRPE
ncbi:MAG: SDR family oxidoreductase [Austwickia sp.]|nr:SDR family oxidoreductase [Austwickia sp.]